MQNNLKDSLRSIYKLEKINALFFIEKYYSLNMIEFNFHHPTLQFHIFRISRYKKEIQTKSFEEFLK